MTTLALTDAGLGRRLEQIPDHGEDVQPSQPEIEVVPVLRGDRPAERRILLPLRIASAEEAIDHPPDE